MAVLVIARVKGEGYSGGVDRRRHQDANLSRVLF